jgi:hypothetical protein
LGFFLGQQFPQHIPLAIIERAGELPAEAIDILRVKESLQNRSPARLIKNGCNFALL